MTDTPGTPPSPIDDSSAPLRRDAPEAGHLRVLSFDTPIFTGGLYTDVSELHAFLSILPRQIGQSADIASIRAAIDDAGILLTNRDEQKLDAVLLRVIAGEEVRMALIAEGQKPTGGGEARLEWAVDYFQTRTTDMETRIDYREVSEIRNVRAGDRLLTIVPPDPPEAGRNVFGRMISAPGTKTILVTAGNNVERGEDARSYFAKIDGRIIFSANHLDISPIMNIEGDVDFSTGNIVFNGSVVIKGNVLDGFRVKAIKGITIGGSVGAAFLEAGDDIEIAGGVSGKGKGVLTVGGHLKAKYLSAVTVEAQGNVEAGTEIMNSTVSAIGKVSVRKGPICGGEVMALGGIVAPVLGSPMGVKTKVSVGINFSSEKRARELRDGQAVHTRTIRTISEKLGPFLQDRERLARLPPDKLLAVRTMLQQLQEAKEQLGAIEADQRKVIEEQERRQDRTIGVLRVVHAGVELQLGEHHKICLEDMAGPIRIYYNTAEGAIRVRGL